MQKLQAFRYQIKTDGAGERAMRRFAGCRRWVMNEALKLQKQNYEAGGKYIPYNTLAKQLMVWRAAPQTAWLKDAPFHVLQQALRDLDRAYQNFFAGRAAFPTFKKKGQGDSFRFPDPKQFTVDEGNSRIKLPKLGWVRYRNSRKVEGECRSVTVSAKAGKWYASVQTQATVPDPVPVATSAIGIDMGVARFMALSDGSFVDAPATIDQHTERIKEYQRRMSRKVKFSSNWKKEKMKLTRAHARAANARNDFLHKTSTTLSKSHALVAHEDLQIVNMTASAAGTVDKPGVKVAQKRGLNRSIMEQGWGEFFRQVEYKTLWQGGYRTAVPPHHTSQTCPCCGNVNKANRRTRSHFLCTVCWYENHADTVGGINVLDRALATLYNQGQDIGRIACEVNGVVVPSATGTHRSDVREVSYAP